MWVVGNFCRLFQIDFLNVCATHLLASAKVEPELNGDLIVVAELIVCPAVFYQGLRGKGLFAFTGSDVQWRGVK